MKVVPIKEANDGDVLADDVLAQSGSMILAKGGKLSASMIARLAKMGVTTVSVVNADDPDEKANLGLQLDLLEKRFKGCEENPYLMEMMRISVGHLEGV